MQCPPTPMPGRWMCENGCELAASITRLMSIPARSANRANSFASAMLTSRYVVSASFVNSAASAEPIARTSASRNARYSSTPRRSPSTLRPPTSFGYVSRSRKIRPEYTRSGL